MRILQVHTPYRLEGGEDKVVREEAAQLRRRGHDVVQHCVPNPEGGLETVGALAVAPWNRDAAREVTALVRKVRPDVAHVHNTWFRLSPSVLQAVHDLGVPLVMTLHNYRLLCLNAQLLRDGRVCEDCVGKVPWRGVVHRCYRRSAGVSAIAATTLVVGRVRHTWDRAVDLFIAPSDFIAAKAAEGGLPAERIVIKVHGTADPGPRPVPPSQSSEVLFVGRLSPEKGAGGLIEAWTAAAPAGLTLSVVGDGPLRAALEARRVPGVRFLGWREAGEVRSLMLSARALAFPSIWYEGAPYVVTEALAAGLPVMASNLGSAGQIAGQLGDAWVASPPSAAGWESALARLADPVTVDTAAAAARRLYEAEYTLDHSTDGLLSAYSAAIDALARRTA